MMNLTGLERNLCILLRHENRHGFQDKEYESKF